MRIRAAALVCLALACNRAPEPPATATVADPPLHAAPAPPSANVDDDNLLNIAYGAALVSRTAENTLEGSAVHGIDGIGPTNWASPPGDPNQTLVYSFAAPSRVEQLGIWTGTPEANVPDAVRFEASMDAKSWREVHVLVPTGSTTANVTPFEARYLRITTRDAKDYQATVGSFQAIGRELAPPSFPSLEGCWTINFEQARFTQRGARITGTIGDTLVDGGTDGRVARLMWKRGATWGYAVATVTPDGRNLSATTFHEEPRVQYVGAAWIGSRCEPSGAGRPEVDAQAERPESPTLDALKRHALFGLAFDPNDQLLIEPSAATLDELAALKTRFRLVAHEFAYATPEENKRRADARLASLRAALLARGVDLARIEFVASGSQRPDTEAAYAVERLLWSRIDLEFSGT
ncbi:MAG TPA: discoidin domain-containing protein [Thermoanaerobaculia bacterium]|nr:discoidin domain-containing protein [Thermoanaerobaculia bacterium]